MQHYKIQKSLKSTQSDATERQSESVVEHVKNVTPSHELPEEELFEPNIEVTYIIPQEELANSVIEERFVVGELIARGHIGNVWNGNRMIFVQKRAKKKRRKTWIFDLSTGFDQVTSSDIAIKFAQPGIRAEVLENEYQNYLRLGAKGNWFNFRHLILCGTHDQIQLDKNKFW